MCRRGGVVKSGVNVFFIVLILSLNWCFFFRSNIFVSSHPHFFLGGGVWDHGKSYGFEIRVILLLNKLPTKATWCGELSNAETFNSLGYLTYPNLYVDLLTNCKSFFLILNTQCFPFQLYLFSVMKWRNFIRVKNV